MEYKTLSNGIKIPMLGYGVFQVSADDCERCVSDALEVGYRSIDTAQHYFNEEQVGNALKNSGIARSDIFLTTKVMFNSNTYDKAKTSIYKSLEKLKTDYLDLCFIHHPIGDYYSAYRAMEELYREGVIRALGVSNFYPAILVNIVRAVDIPPMINQIEIHPLHQQADAIEWAEKYGLAVEAWAPLGQGASGLLNNPVLKKIGEKYGKTTAQVMLKWNVQRGIIVIPRSTKKERMLENFSVFDFTLSDEDMALIATLETGKTLFFDHITPQTAERFWSRIK